MRGKMFLSGIVCGIGPRVLARNRVVMESCPQARKITQEPSRHASNGGGVDRSHMDGSGIGPSGWNSCCRSASNRANCSSVPSPSQRGITTCFANRPVITVLNFEVFLPRSVRGPVERLAFRRFAASFFSVSVFLGMTTFPAEAVRVTPSPLETTLTDFVRESRRKYEIDR